MHFDTSLFCCLPLLTKWDGATNAHLAVPSGDMRAALAPGGGLRAARLSFHSLCPGATLSVPSKMPEHTRICEVSGTDPEELQEGQRGGSSTMLHFRPHAEQGGHFAVDKSPGTHQGSQQKHVI